MGRVQSIVARANQKLTVQFAALLISGSALASLIFGFLRQRLLNANYYETYPEGIDAYLAAFTVPDFMYFILVSGALSVTFIPVFNQRLASGNKKSAWELSTSLINLMAIVTLIASVLIIIFAEPLITQIIAPGLDESSTGLAVSMMRVIAINPFLFAIATVIASIQQAVGRFTFYALAPVIYNIGIIIGIVFFTQGIELFGVRVFDGGIMGVALGVVLGSIMQLLLSSIGLIGLGFDYRFKIYWKNKGFRKVLSLLPARSLDQGMDYFVSIVEVNLASRISRGAITAYSSATMLHQAPISLVGVAISTAAFPSLTERLAEGRIDLFKNELRKVLRYIIWISLPVAVIAFFTRGYLASFLYSKGDILIAGALGGLVGAIFFRSIYYIVARSFYAQQDTKTPFYVSIFAISINIALAVWFSMVLDLGVYGLAYAQSIVAMIEVVILMTIMNRRLGGMFNRRFWNSVTKMAMIVIPTGIVCYILTALIPFQGGDGGSWIIAVPRFAFIATLSLLCYLIISKLCKIEEADPVIRQMQKYGKKLIRLIFGGVRG